MTTGKTIALTRWTFVGKVMSLLFNHLLKGPSPNKVLGFRMSAYEWGCVHEPAHNRWPDEVRAAARLSTQMKIQQWGRKDQLVIFTSWGWAMAQAQGQGHLGGNSRVWLLQV